MKPDWDKLGDFFNKPESLAQIADVDCTADKGQELCDRYSVQGYPTIKYFSRDVSEMGELYEGDRDYKQLKKFVKSNSKAPCNSASLEHCSKKEIAFIEESKDWDVVQVEAEILLLKSQVNNATKEHNDFADLFDKQKEEAMSTAKQMEQAQKEMEKLTKHLQPRLNILQQAASKLGVASQEEL